MARRIVGIANRRRIIRAIADEQGCIINPDGCCDGLDGSGIAGSGACSGQCFQACDQCTAGMSASWTLYITGLTPIQLCRVEHPSDLNYCRFNSPDLTWDLRYEHADGLWILTNLNTGHVWYLPQLAWACQAENSLFPVDDGDTNAVVTPDFDCSVISYDCTSGGCVGLVGTGGLYPTLFECEAACGGGGGIVTTCCPSNEVPTTLYVHFTGSLAAVGTVTLTYNAMADAWVGTGAACSISTIRMECSSVSDLWVLELGPAATVASEVAATCSPFEAVFTGTGSVCSGAFTATVNATP